MAGERMPWDSVAAKVNSRRAMLRRRRWGLLGMLIILLLGALAHLVAVGCRRTRVPPDHDVR
jgi:hypothetical protein